PRGRGRDSLEDGTPGPLGTGTGRPGDHLPSGGPWVRGDVTRRQLKEGKRGAPAVASGRRAVSETRLTHRRDTAMVVPQLPFGKHKNRALNDPEVPASYLAWMLRECRLGSGFRRAVADELRRRGWNIPEQPAPQPPLCPDCRSAAEPRYTWQED